MACRVPTTRAEAKDRHVIIAQQAVTNDTVTDEKQEEQPSGADVLDTQEHTLLHLTAAIGSKRYQAPEVGRGDPYNLKAEVYSFGLICWEIWTLEKPYGVDLQQGTQPFRLSTRATAFFGSLFQTTLQIPAQVLAQ